jgi:hypothetical protein
MIHLLGTANVVPSSLNLSTLMIETIRSSKTSVLTRVTRRHIPEDGVLHDYCCYRIRQIKQIIAYSVWPKHESRDYL